MTYIRTSSRDSSWLLSKLMVFMMLLTQILSLTMEISMINNFLKKTIFCILCIGYFSPEKGRELVKEYQGDARTIISTLHHYHTQSNVAQHEVVTLTTYITNLNLTDSWKCTTRQILSRFKEKLRLSEFRQPLQVQSHLEMQGFWFS